MRLLHNPSRTSSQPATSICPFRHSLAWQKVGLTQEPCGSSIEGRLCPLPDEPHHAEGVHAVVYEWQGVAHNYRVRLRLGWSHLRELLSRVRAWLMRVCVHLCLQQMGA